jgi:hypothetical protein
MQAQLCISRLLAAMRGGNQSRNYKITAALLSQEYMYDIKALSSSRALGIKSREERYHISGLQQGMWVNT